MTPTTNSKTGYSSNYRGRVFGDLTVIQQEDDKKLTCRCICGKEVQHRLPRLASGHVLSCGCRKKRVSGRTHGMSHTSEYRSWYGMKTRCLNPNNFDFKDYGGRGITIDPTWIASFIAFYRDMGPKPDPSLTIDRKDPDGNYCKDNCRWATRAVQIKNTRRSKNAEE
jgi:hypothetical protein